MVEPKVLLEVETQGFLNYIKDFAFALKAGHKGHWCADEVIDRTNKFQVQLENIKKERKMHEQT